MYGSFDPKGRQAALASVQREEGLRGRIGGNNMYSWTTKYMKRCQTG
ncbi:hypothetical protein BQ8794_490016 [Mesorhizobium prunaredense]|uniref:Uncharacterized protein n=1 Tax=Mesorhizobium prunaredense TaxID=1631249 RepID=A0A1R3VDA8_9HYPH|nr:hypothetical protein BQ8794_490016 [Mesorhizobium prunaredense]